MSNFKLVKTAAALALGASVVTSAVATTDASAASKYKIKSGKLVYAKSGKVVKGYVTYKSTVYKNGKKLTGLKGKTYYKAGKKATGTYKGAYYVKGVKKVTTGTYNKAYYVKGVKKVTTGLYGSKYYKYGKVATGTYKGAYYVKGIKKVTTGTYNGAYYVKGYKKVTTGLYADKLYVDGKLNKGYKLYNEDLYKDAVLNTELALFEGKLYDGAKLNEGHKIFKDELYNGSELNKELALFEGKLYDGAKLNEGIKKFEDKWYNNAELADGTFTDEGVEKAFENGVEVGAKVKSVEAINAKTVKFTFNKAVDASTLIDNKGTTTTTDDVLKAGTVKFTALDGQTAVTIASANATLSEDGKTLTLVASAAEFFTKRYTVDVTDAVKDKAGNKFEAFSKTVDTTDNVQPEITGTSYEDNGFTLKVQLSEPVQSVGTVKLFNGTTELAVTPVLSADKTYFTVDLSPSTIPANTALTLQVVGASDFNSNVLKVNPYTTTITKTAVDTVAPTVSSIESLSDTKVKVTFSEKLKANPTVTVNGKATTISAADTEGKVFYATLAPADKQTGVQSVVVSAFSDVAGNAGTTYTKVVDMKADTTAPTLTSSEVKKVDGVEKLILTFDEAVTPQNAVTLLNGTTDRYTDEDGVSKVLTTAFVTATATNFALYNAVDGVSKQVALDITALPKGTYTVNIAGAVKDLASTPNANASKSVTFTRTANSSTVKPTVSVSAVSNDYVEFTYSQDVDASALNLANYNIDGIQLDSAEYYGAKNVVRVYLKAGANSVTGTRTITVKNVQNASGLAIDNTTTTKTIKENVAPTFTATLVDANTVKVVFSEAVSHSTVATALSASNFTVKYDGAANVVTAVNEDNIAVPTAAAGTTGYTTVYLKLATPVADLAKSLTVNASSIQDVTKTGSLTPVTDEVGNAVSTATVNVTK